MRERCLNQHHRYYNDYGGRGIKICDEWLQSFLPFEAWALANGYADHLELDRVDNDGDYTPENCRWTTRKENFNNRRTTRFLTAFGERKTMQQWTEDERCAVDYATIWARVGRGWSHERAITEPTKIPRKLYTQLKLNATLGAYHGNQLR